MTRTIIELTDETFNAVADELMRAGRHEAIVVEKDRSVSLDMHGICVLRKAENVVDLPRRRLADVAEFLKGFE